VEADLSAKAATLAEMEQRAEEALLVPSADNMRDNNSGSTSREAGSSGVVKDPDALHPPEGPHGTDPTESHVSEEAARVAEEKIQRLIEENESIRRLRAETEAELAAGAQEIQRLREENASIQGLRAESETSLKREVAALTSRGEELEREAAVAVAAAAASEIRVSEMMADTEAKVAAGAQEIQRLREENESIQGLREESEASLRGEVAALTSRGEELEREGAAAAAAAAAAIAASESRVSLRLQEESKTIQGLQDKNESILRLRVVTEAELAELRGQLEAAANQVRYSHRLPHHWQAGLVVSNRS
jgi:chromosome segregation ATPase